MRSTNPIVKKAFLAHLMKRLTAYQRLLEECQKLPDSDTSKAKLVEAAQQNVNEAKAEINDLRKRIR